MWNASCGVAPRSDAEERCLLDKIEEVSGEPAPEKSFRCTSYVYFILPLDPKSVKNLFEDPKSCKSFFQRHL